MSDEPSDWWLPSIPDTVDVEPEDLAHLADLLESDRAHFTLSKADGFDELFLEYPPFEGGGDGLAEGRTFQNTYFHVSYAMNCLLTDVHNGLWCLQQAARAIAAEYAEGDAFSAATVDSVHRALEDVVTVGLPGAGPIPPAEQPGPVDIADGDNVRSTEDMVIREGQPGEVVYRGDNNDVRERGNGEG